MGFSHCILTSNFENYLRNTQNNLKELIGNNFLIEHRELHLTFLFFGRGFNANQDFINDVNLSVNSLDPKDKKIRFNKLDIFDTKFGKLLVLKVEVSERLKKLRNELYSKYGIEDKIKNYNPHVTLGKIRGNVNINPYINSDEFVINGVKFK